MALAAELLLLSSSASSHHLPPKSQGKKHPPCEMCKKVESRYKCPGCSLQTCSVACCQLHKQKLGCDGKRDETLFKSMSQFTDSDLLSDYLFLERASRLVGSSRRGFRKFRLEFRSDWVKKLIWACKRRAINLRVMAPNMSRGFLNKTCYVAKNDLILWQIEWVFPYISRKYIQNGVHETDLIPAALWNLMQGDVSTVPILRPYRVCFDKNEAEDKPGTCRLKFLIRVKPNRHSFDRWLLADCQKSLAGNLRSQCIVEHPTITVLLPEENEKDYLKLNGKVPSWFTEKPMPRQGMQSKQSDEGMKEEGEVSQDDDDQDEKESDEIAAQISDSDEDGPPLEIPIGRPENIAQPKPTSSFLPLVAYNSDSE